MNDGTVTVLAVDMIATKILAAILILIVFFGGFGIWSAWHGESCFTICGDRGVRRQAWPVYCECER